MIICSMPGCQTTAGCRCGYARLSGNTSSETRNDKSLLTADLVRLLGWLDHCERTEPYKATNVPTWLCEFSVLSKAVEDGYVKETGRQTLHPCLGWHGIIYGMTDKGREIFYAALPRTIHAA